jgi:triphosphatase
MLEVEWQLDAVDLRPVERWLQARTGIPSPDAVPAGQLLPRAAAGDPLQGITFNPLPQRTLNDTYFDTADWRLHRAGLTLRIRSEAEQATATLKSMEAARDGLRSRMEVEDPLPGADTSALLASDTRAGAWVRALAGPEALVPLFSLETTRAPHELVLGEQAAGEIALDDIQIPLAGEREPARMKRVEVEIAPALVEALRPFLEDMRSACRLTPGTATKFEAGLLARDLHPQPLPELGPTTILPTQTTGELAFAVLRRHFQALMANEPGTRIGEDPEALHDMRVAARRLRAAISLFAPALPSRADRLRDELRWIGGTLGNVRDQDIQLERIATWAKRASEAEVTSLSILSVVLERRRERARLQLLRALDSRRYRRFVERFTSMLQHGPLRRSMNSRTPAMAVLPDLIAEHHARVVKLGDRIGTNSKPETYHRLRIRAKRLRYAVEFSRDVYGAQASGFIKAMTALQDILGLHQDAYVAVSSLEALLGAEARRLPPRALFMMGQISQRYMQEAARLRKRFPKVYRQVKGKPWSRLQQEMESDRPAAWPESFPPPAKTNSETLGG